MKVAVDNPDNIRALGAAATAAGVEIGVLVEVELGMGRAGVAPTAAAALSRLVHETPGLRYLGVMGWEGHTVGMTDPAAKRDGGGALRRSCWGRVRPPAARRGCP